MLQDCKGPWKTYSGSGHQQWGFCCLFFSSTFMCYQQSDKMITQLRQQRNICPRWNHTGPKVHAKNSGCDCDTCSIFYPSNKLCHGWALFVYYNDHVESVTYHCFFSPGWKYKPFLLCQSLHFYLIGPMRCCLCVGTAVYVYLLLVLLKPEQMKSFSCPIKKYDNHQRNIAVHGVAGFIQVSHTV